MPGQGPFAFLRAASTTRTKSGERTVPTGGDADFSRSWDEAFKEAERSGFRLQLKARAIVLLLVAVSFFFTVTPERALTYGVFCFVLVAIGWATERIVLRLPACWWRLPAALLILIDVTILSVVLALPRVSLDHPWPPQMAMRFFSFLYLPLYVMGSALTTSPTLVLWTGAGATAAWSACVWWVLQQPGTLTVGSLRLIDADIATADQIRLFLDPHFVSIVAYQSQVLVLLLGSAVLAFGVGRSRRFLLERTLIAAERQNLARFVPSDLADDLAQGPSSGTVRRQSVSVMFADIVGFTAMAEWMKPEDVLEMLGGFRERMTRIVVDHGGTVDKFIGDAVMATFGIGRQAAEAEAARALACAVAASDAFDSWNRERGARGEPSLRIGIGLHCGEALVGTVGTAERLEHTVIGDVVNVASRLERLTREHGTSLLASEALFQAVGAEAAGSPPFDRFGPPRPLSIRGRSGALSARALASGSRQDGQGEASRRFPSPVGNAVT